MQFRTPPRRLLFLALVAAALGLLGGGAAYVLIKLIALLTNLALLHRVGWELPSFRNFDPDWTLIPAAVGGGLVVSLMAKWAPVIRGHGGGAHQAEPDPAPSSRCQALVGRRRHRHRRTVRRRGSDHRDGRGAGIALGAGAPRLARRAQDPLGVGSGRGDGSHVRHPA